jgi:hypothetical protein
MNIYLDLETIPTDRAAVRDYIAATITPPGTMKKAETIAAWVKDDKPAAIEEAVNRTSLDGAFGRVFCIGWAVDDDAPTSLYGMNEPTILEAFAAVLHDMPVSERFSTTIIGHNVAAFDLRFLVQRYIVNGIRPPFVIAKAAEAKPWEKSTVYDTMVQWAGAGNRVSLDKLCLALGIESPKGELDGSKVWQWVQDGKHEEVAAYCERDVAAAREVHRRMTFAHSFEDVPA